jgi:hypothetical protein
MPRIAATSRLARFGLGALALGLVACSTATAAPPLAPEVQPPAATQAKMATDAQHDVADWGVRGDPNYAPVVQKITGMLGDSALRAQVDERGLSLLDVMWEDTGRSLGSSVGPNISDLTLQVRYTEPGAERETTALMPVIRFPNFSDRTGDVPADKFFVRVGNERDGSRLRTVALTDVLRNVKKYTSRPWTIGGDGNLLAARDTHFLMSAQAVFLPISQSGKAEFNPVVFNYQSAPGAPAVLTMLVTRQGTSITVIENRPEDGTIHGMGQELYFNNAGQRAAFTAERKSAVAGRIAAQGGPKTVDDQTALEKGADVLFLIQVPLKHKSQRRFALKSAPMAMADDDGGAMDKEKSARRSGSDVEQAVLGHGENRGPFVEGNDLKLERDERFPIRITVQFYKATSNGVVDAKDLDDIARSIGNVYEHADFVGSLVVPSNDRLRPTAWNQAPAGWFAF